MTDYLLSDELRDAISCKTCPQSVSNMLKAKPKHLMTSFTWKRRNVQRVCKETAETFSKDSIADDCHAIESAEDLSSHGKRKVIALEDRETKKKRLQDEGCLLAENNRLWEAIRKWDEAIHLVPNEGRLFEMKAQALMELQEELPSIQAAKQAVVLCPTWWVAYQTLGRAQLNMGEVSMAIKSFSKACHLNPAENDLWFEDLQWAVSLRERALTAANVTPQSTNIVCQLEDKDSSLQQSCTDTESFTTTQSSSIRSTETKMLSIKSWIRMRAS